MAGTGSAKNMTHVENSTQDGGVAQLGERLVRNEEVRGSNPLISTTSVTLDPIRVIWVRCHFLFCARDSAYVCFM